MKHLRWTALFATGSLALLALGCPEDDPDPPEVAEYEVELAGENEVPPIATPATGTMDVTLDEDDILTIEGEFSGLVAELLFIEGTPAHIHEGSATETGPIVWDVQVDADDDNTSGTFSLTRQLTSEEVATFEANQYYLNIHTEAYPGGELRGQLDEDAPEFENIRDSWGVTLTPEAQPHSVDSDADGWAWVILRGDDSMVVSGAANNLTSNLTEIDGSAVNIEEGELDEPGDVVMNLNYEALPDIDGVRFWGTADLTDDEVDALTGDDYFINVYTEDFPAGELRGQILFDNGFFEELWDDFFGDDAERIDEAPPF